MWDHIAENAKVKGLHTINVGGYIDHCHCLMTMTHDQSISKIAQLLKGESSHWINKAGLLLNNLQNEKFEWQNDYFVESVSPRLLSSIQNYIISQEIHHRVPGFRDEYDDYLDELNQ